MFSETSGSAGLRLGLLRRRNARAFHAPRLTVRSASAGPVGSGHIRFGNLLRMVRSVHRVPVRDDHPLRVLQPHGAVTDLPMQVVLYSILGGHLKTGQSSTGQNRPMAMAQTS